MRVGYVDAVEWMTSRRLLLQHEQGVLGVESAGCGQWQWIRGLPTGLRC